MSLKKFERRDVTAASIKVTRAGDGLSQALKVDPVEYHHGDTVYVVLECTVTNIDYPMVKGSEELVRRHTLTAGTATTVDAELVKAVLEEQRIRIEQALGVERLDFDGDSE